MIIKIILLLVVATLITSAQIVPQWSTSLFHDVSDDNTVPLRYTGSAPFLVSNCGQHAQLYMHEYIYLSMNKFKTPLAPLRIPASLLKMDDPIVDTAIVRSDSIVFLVNGTVYLYSLEDVEFRRVGGLERHPVSTIQFSQYCCKHALCKEWSDTIVALSHLEDGSGEHKSMIFALRQGMVEFVHIPLPDGLQNLHIVATVPILPWHSIAILTTNPEQDGPIKKAIFHYLPIETEHEVDTDNHEVTIMRALSHSLDNDLLRLVHLTDRFGDFLLWGSRELFLSQTAGQTFLSIGGDVETYLNEDELIQTLVPGTDGAFAFMTSQGRLWYGQSSLETHVAELVIPGKISSSSAFIFDGEGHITILNARHYDLEPAVNATTNHMVYLSSDLVYPSEILNEQENNLPACPFLLFKPHFGSELFYIDIGHKMNLRATFIPGPFQTGNIMIYPSNPSIIRLNISLETGDPIGRGFNKIEVSADVSLTADSADSGVETHIEGLATVTFTTTESGLTCLPNPSHQAYIYAGCPPNKRIQLRKQVNREKCTYLRNYVYTFFRDEYDPSFMEGSHGVIDDQGDLSIQYDYGTHGCPDLSYYSDGYQPQFDLYIGDEFLESMDAEYALIEIHGVHNYEYRMNTKGIGCTRRPQNWVEMLTRQNDTRDPNSAWTRYNYESCIEANGTRIEERLPYQVMSSQTKNKILWRERKVIYVFNVTVLDPVYSYCNLKTQFAVEVYGALPPSSVSDIKVMLITCLLGFVGVAFIFIYFKLRLKHAEEEQIEQKTIPQFPH